MKNKTFGHLYNQDDKKIMKQAEDSLNPKLDRVDEIISFAKHAGIKTIGIANCIAFTKEANHLEGILNSNGFKTAKVDCKYGKVPFDHIVKDYKGTSCNPAGQAEYLAENKTELNIMMGLCIGHDMIFNIKSKAPVTPLVVKDRKLKHHSLQKFSE